MIDGWWIKNATKEQTKRKNVTIPATFALHSILGTYPLGVPLPNPLFGQMLSKHPHFQCKDCNEAQTVFWSSLQDA